MFAIWCEEQAVGTLEGYWLQWGWALNTSTDQNNQVLFKIHVIDHCELPNLDARLNTDNNLFSHKIHSRYFSPHNLKKYSNSLTKKQLESSFSIFHNNIVSLNNNLEKLVSHYLENLDFHFDIIGITESKITHTNQNFATKIPAYAFEHLPTPLHWWKP